jgi:hypothetical protein
VAADGQQRSYIRSMDWGAIYKMQQRDGEQPKHLLAALKAGRKILSWGLVTPSSRNRINFGDKLILNPFAQHSAGDKIFNLLAVYPDTGGSACSIIVRCVQQCWIGKNQFMPITDLYVLRYNFHIQESASGQRGSPTDI